MPNESEATTLLGRQPIDRFTTGALFPVVKGDMGIDPDSEEENNDVIADISEKSAVEPAQKKRRYAPPSSVGFSYYIIGDNIELQVQAWAVKYVQEGIKDDKGVYRDEAGRFIINNWLRKPLCMKDADTLNLRSPAIRSKQQQHYPAIGGHGKIHILWRPLADGWLVTISLCNTFEMQADCKPEEWRQAYNAQTLFEAELLCTVDTGEVGPYPHVDQSLLTDEERELELQYKGNKIYSIGHGASADWSIRDGRVYQIWSDFMPTVEVPQVISDVGAQNTQVLSIGYLAGCGSSSENIFSDLDQFVSEYSTWGSGQKLLADTFELDDRKVAARITERIIVAVSRMKQGIAFLSSNTLGARAFGIANQAMLDQMRQHDVSQGNKPRTYSWRPFQLAFLLTVIESSVNEDSEYRDILDLIWFPTGGGKTEAYLGLIAFLVAWRRMKFQTSGGGTTVLMRYTLRLLTAQQYQRATRLICALELIRRENPDLGSEPITIGMWVGKETCPNTFKKAEELIDKSSKGNYEPPRNLILDKCPWCRTTFKAPDNYEVSANRFHFRCANLSCDFGQSDSGLLPCNVVDEALYMAPPTLLIATIDKFAQLAWDERTSAFFGNKLNRPPELIIQDELHLIAGALGSIAGLYEAALEVVLIRRGVRPKYIASTATIRTAETQVKRLYGKNVSIFPPPGLSCDDSHFAKTVSLETRAGRLYVGFLAPLLDRQHCMAPLAAALLPAQERVFDVVVADREILLEAWWTLVVYHGSLKGVGSSHNAFFGSVREYRRLHLAQGDHDQTIEQASPVSDGDGTFDNNENHSSRQNKIVQLTSTSSSVDNAKTFSLLEKRRNETGCLDVVLATNMISVGLDVNRLALMIVNGQPLTTSEYIQASSRVGRSEVPGLVFVNYYRSQARSLSHYENFRPYHESFYRFVEPTSIAPYTYQARRRALHAALVIAIRHSCPVLLANNTAGSFDMKQDDVAKTLEILINRCRQGDKDRSQETSQHIQKLVQEWQAEAIRCRNIRRLDYRVSDNDKTTDRLLYNYDDQIKGLWPTLQSMRNVEVTALLKQL